MPFHIIRAAELADASEMASMFANLGHPIGSESITQRWNDWAAAGNFALVAQQTDGPIVGVATLHQMMVLHRPQPVGRITSLFVDAAVRGCGVARALVTAAETALARRGCTLVEITSHFRFAEAHSFYEHLGYSKTSLRLAKELAVP